MLRCNHLLTCYADSFLIIVHFNIAITAYSLHHLLHLVILFGLLGKVRITLELTITVWLWVDVD